MQEIARGKNLNTQLYRVGELGNVIAAEQGMAVYRRRVAPAPCSAHQQWPRTAGAASLTPPALTDRASQRIERVDASKRGA